MTRIWLVNWHFQSRITLWCRHKSTNVFIGLCWQMPKFIVWRLWSIYFDHHLPLKPSIGKRRKQSCAPNILRHILLRSNTTGSALTLLCISSNITAVTVVTLTVLLYFQMILETCMIDQHLNFINLKIEIISISIRTRISLTRLW